MSINTELVGVVPTGSYSSGPTYKTLEDGGHSINQYEALCFATTVVPNNNASNAMMSEQTIAGIGMHEGYSWAFPG